MKTFCIFQAFLSSAVPFLIFVLSSPTQIQPSQCCINSIITGKGWVAIPASEKNQIKSKQKAEKGEATYQPVVKEVSKLRF